MTATDSPSVEEAASAKPPVVLIAGTYCFPEVWDAMKAELEQRGYEVHAPPLRYHDLPLLEGARKMASLSLLDYTADFVNLINGLDRPPIIVGWSMGGLIAQLVAQRVEHAGLMLLSPAPSAGMFAMYPSMFATFQPHFSRWGFWRKPLMPDWDLFVWSTGHLQSQEFMENCFNQLKAESGRAYFEMALWFLDKTKASKVIPENIKGPVLVISGAEDRIVVPAIGRRTAAKYAKGRFILLSRAEHMLPDGTGLPKVMAEFDKWVEEFGL